MLLAGEIDAAILAEPPKDGPLKPLIPDPAAAAAAWKAKNRRDPDQPHGDGEEHGVGRRRRRRSTTGSWRAGRRRAIPR